MNTYKNFLDKQKPVLTETEKLDEVTMTAMYAVNKLRTMVKKVKSTKDIGTKLDKAVEGLAIALGVLNLQWNKQKKQRR